MSLFNRTNLDQLVEAKERHNSEVLCCNYVVCALAQGQQNNVCQSSHGQTTFKECTFASHSLTSTSALRASDYTNLLTSQLNISKNHSLVTVNQPSAL